MKTSILPLIAFLLLSADVRAESASKDVHITKIARLSATECAIQLVFCGNEQRFTANDWIQIDGQNIINMQGIIDAGINNDGANHNGGDTILAASASFNSRLNTQTDLVFNDSDCPRFTSSAEFSYVSDGTVINSLQASQVNGFGNDQTAIFQEVSMDPNFVAQPVFINLANSFTFLAKNNKETVRVGFVDENLNGIDDADETKNSDQPVSDSDDTIDDNNDQDNSNSDEDQINDVDSDVGAEASGDGGGGCNLRAHARHPPTAWAVLFLGVPAVLLSMARRFADVYRL